MVTIPERMATLAKQRKTLEECMGFITAKLSQLKEQETLARTECKRIRDEMLSHIEAREAHEKAERRKRRAEEDEKLRVQEDRRREEKAKVEARQQQARQAQEENTKRDQQVAKDNALAVQERKRQKTSERVATEEGKKKRAEEYLKQPQKSKDRKSKKYTKKAKGSAQLETLMTSAPGIQRQVQSAIEADYPNALLVQGIQTSAGSYWNGTYEKRGIMSGKPTWCHTARHKGKTLFISKPADNDKWCISYKDYSMIIAEGSRTSYLPQTSAGNEWRSVNGDYVTVSVFNTNVPAMNQVRE